MSLEDMLTSDYLDTRALLRISSPLRHQHPTSTTRPYLHHLTSVRRKVLMRSTLGRLKRRRRVVWAMYPRLWHGVVTFLDRHLSLSTWSVAVGTVAQ